MYSHCFNTFLKYGESMTVNLNYGGGRICNIDDLIWYERLKFNLSYHIKSPF